MADVASRLVCGLGNGLCFRQTRHSLGLRLLERLAASLGVPWKLHPRLAAYVALSPGGLQRPHDLVLLWPLLPYNMVGWSVKAAADQFRIASGNITGRPTHVTPRYSSATLHPRVGDT